MKLLLIRHAKSGWDDMFADDHVRDLTARGHQAARLIGQWLVLKGHVPGHIIASDSVRTRETAAGIIAQIPTAPALSFHPALYHASPETIAALIRGQPQDVLAVIGHNPGIGMLANALVTDPPAHHRFEDYPTCATTVIDIDPAIRPRSGTCLDFVVPRDLTD